MSSTPGQQARRPSHGNPRSGDRSPRHSNPTNQWDPRRQPQYGYEQYGSSSPHGGQSTPPYSQQMSAQQLAAQQHQAAQQAHVAQQQQLLAAQQQQQQQQLLVAQQQQQQLAAQQAAAAAAAAHQQMQHQQMHQQQAAYPPGYGKGGSSARSNPSNYGRTRGGTGSSVSGVEVEQQQQQVAAAPTTPKDSRGGGAKTPQTSERREKGDTSHYPKVTSSKTPGVTSLIAFAEFKPQCGKLRSPLNFPNDWKCIRKLAEANYGQVFLFYNLLEERYFVIKRMGNDRYSADGSCKGQGLLERYCKGQDYEGENPLIELGAAQYASIVCPERDSLSWFANDANDPFNPHAPLMAPSVEGLDFACPYLLQMRGCWTDQHFTYYASDFCKGGELFSFVVGKQRIGEDEARKIIRQIMVAVKYLHDRGIAHRDISLENVLLTEEPDDRNVRLMDFGVACAIYGDWDLNFQEWGRNPSESRRNSMATNGGREGDFAVNQHLIRSGNTPRNTDSRGLDREISGMSGPSRAPSMLSYMHGNAGHLRDASNASQPGGAARARAGSNVTNGGATPTGGGGRTGSRILPYDPAGGTFVEQRIRRSVKLASAINPNAGPDSQNRRMSMVSQQGGGGAQSRDASPRGAGRQQSNNSAISGHSGRFETPRLSRDNSTSSVRAARENAQRERVPIYIHGYVGKDYYRAPEIYGRGALYLPAPTDIFAVGVCIFVMVTGRPIWKKAQTPDSIYLFVRSRGFRAIANQWKLQQMPLNLSDELIDLLCKMLDFTPENRPTSEEVLSHPWFYPEGDDDGFLWKDPVSQPSDVSDVRGSSRSRGHELGQVEAPQSPSGGRGNKRPAGT